MGWTIYFTNYETYARSADDLAELLEVCLLDSNRWSLRHRALPGTRSEVNIWEGYDSHGKLARQAIVVRDAPPKWANPDTPAPEYDFFLGFSGTGLEKLPEHHVVADDNEAYALMTAGKKAWRDMWTIDSRNGVWVLRQFSRGRDGRQMCASVMIPRLHLTAPEPEPTTTPEPPRKRTIPRQYTRRQLEKMDLPAVRKIAETRGISMKPRTRKATYIDAILGEGPKLPEVEISPVTVGHDTSPQLAGAMIKGGWEEAQRIMSMGDLAEEERDADGDIVGEIWAYDLDGNVDVTLADGQVVHIDA
jgi:hypothetical protein